MVGVGLQNIKQLFAEALVETVTKDGVVMKTH
jgi:hypothetical protein